MFKYWMYRFGQFCIYRLSLKTSYAIAGFISDLHYWFSFRDRRAVRNNLKIICGPSDNLSHQTKEVFRNFGRYLVEFFLMKKMVNQDFIKQKIKIKNINYVDQILKQGKGGILVTAHLGNWELGAVLMSVLGYPIVAIALPHKERPVNDLFNDQRKVQGVMVVPTHLAIRRCLETLKDNKIVAVVGDRDFSLNGEIMDFLGKKTLIPKGAVMFSFKTKAPIIPTFLIREPDGTFTFSFYEPIYPPATFNGSDEQTIHQNMIKKYLTLIEKKIRQYPTQWLMFREFAIKETLKIKDSLRSKNSLEEPKTNREYSQID